MALSGVNRNLDAYEANRKIDIPLDTEPAIAFHPAHAKKELYTPKTKFRFGRVELPEFKTVEDLAFSTVPQLAELIRTRRITSTDLTKMYLERLKKYGPKLLCVVTLTEDLALKQAAAADAEIKRGKYRGPLHGIPWGAKDLFATTCVPLYSEPLKAYRLKAGATIDFIAEGGAIARSAPTAHIYVKERSDTTRPCGGIGTWTLGAKHPEIWAALGPISGVADPKSGTDFELHGTISFDIVPAALLERRAHRGQSERRRVAIAAEMSEHNSLDFSG